MRTENDSWDIQTSVGSTALFVAAARALEAKKTNPAAVDPYAEVFCRAVGGEWADLLDGGAPEHPLKTEFGEHFVNFQGVRTPVLRHLLRGRGRRRGAPNRAVGHRPCVTMALTRPSRQPGSPRAC